MSLLILSNSKFPNAQTSSTQSIFYDLDNEPGLWNSTHPEVHKAQTTYAEMATRTVNLLKPLNLSLQMPSYLEESAMGGQNTLTFKVRPTPTAVII